MLFRVLAIVLIFTLSACSSWVFKRDMPQGNYLEQKDIDKLQVNMTKEQVKFVLGSPVVIDSFDNNIWNYVYQLKSGRGEKYNAQKRFKIIFDNDRLTSASGDFELPESFNTPMEN